MNTIRTLSGILALAVGACSGAAAQVTAYQADLQQARWRAVAGEAACHLFHDIPLLATVVLSEDAAGGLSTTLLLRRPAQAAQRAGVYRTSPSWKPPRRSRLASVPLSRATTTLGLAGSASRAVSAALEAGDRVDIHYRAVGSDTPSLAAVLSPVRFRAALAEQRRCLAQLQAVAGDHGPAADAVPEVAAGDGVSASGSGGSRAPAADPPDGLRELPPAPETRVYFPHDDAGFDRDAFDRVRELAAALRRAQFWSRIAVVGHADDTGSANRNRRLALARAIEVRNRLIQEGVDPERIQVSARGEDDPAADNATEYGRARNRRVEIRGQL